MRRVRFLLTSLLLEKSQLEARVENYKEQEFRLTSLRHQLLTDLQSYQALRGYDHSKATRLDGLLSQVKQNIKELNQQTKQITNLLRRQSRKYSKYADFNFLMSKGKLPLPIKNGRLESSRQVTDAVYIRALHTGVNAVASGKVAFVGIIPSVGKTVIIAHGKGYFSIYGRLSHVLVRENGVVKKSNPIGRVVFNDLLYFALRLHNKPLNPRKWLIK